MSEATKFEQTCADLSMGLTARLPAMGLEPDQEDFLVELINESNKSCEVFIESRESMFAELKTMIDLCIARLREKHIAPAEKTSSSGIELF